MLLRALVGTLLVTLTAAADCHDYVLISTRGTTELQGPSIGFIRMVDNTLSTVPNGIEYDTVYPASTNLTGVVVGVADVIRYITEGVSACPRQVYGLLGYSQGASVTNIALRNFTQQSAEYKAVKAVVVIGNPGHVPDATGNVDENGGDTTKNATGSYYLGGTGAIPDSYYADGKVLDICYQGDFVCALPPNGTFSIQQAHLLYGGSERVQSLGADFLISKLRGSSTPAPSTSASASASASSTPTRPSSSPSASQSTSAPAATYTGMAAASLPINPGLVLGLAAVVAAM